MVVKKKLRSDEWFEVPELYGWTRRAALQGSGLAPEAYQGRPIIGICNTWSELTHCNAHLRTLAEAVKKGVWQAGGVPLEFPVISLGAVRTGDIIELDVDQRRLDLMVDPREVERRLSESAPPRASFSRGYRRLYTEHVLQADRGCDFDFLI